VSHVFNKTLTSAHQLIYAAYKLHNQYGGAIYSNERKLMHWNSLQTRNPQQCLSLDSDY